MKLRNYMEEKKVQKYLTEKRSNNVIVVDIQPVYNTYIKFRMDLFTSFLNNNRKIFVFYNGPDTVGGNTKNDIIDYYVENGLDESKINDMTFYDKGYGFFRSWMDNGISINNIVKVLRYMIQTKINDSRDIDEKILQKIIPNVSIDDIIDDPIYLPDISLSELKKWSGSYIVGGGRNECLKEFQILMNTFNIRYKVVKDFVY